MGLSTNSQTISNVEDNKDTVILKLHIDDAKLILNDLLDYEICDSTLKAYIEKDSIQLEIIDKQKIVIHNLEMNNQDYEQLIDNKDIIIDNKEEEIELLIEEVKKQKRHKIFAIVGACIMPIITFLIML